MSAYTSQPQFISIKAVEVCQHSSVYEHWRWLQIKKKSCWM